MAAALLSWLTQIRQALFLPRRCPGFNWGTDRLGGGDSKLVWNPSQDTAVESCVVPTFLVWLIDPIIRHFQREVTMIFTINKSLMCRQQTTHHLLSWFVTAYLTNPKNNLLIFYKFISENQRFVSHIFEGNHLSVFRINTQILPSDYMQYFSWSILMWINPLCCIFWDAQSSNYVATSWEPWYRLELWNTTQPQVTKPWFVRSELIISIKKYIMQSKM